MNSYDIIIKPVLSEKSYSGISLKDYTFIVNAKATKTEIKKAVEEVFNVKVDRINVTNYDGKVKRMGRTEGRRSSFKKAYVKLTADSKAIEFFESLS
ncbi:MAG: 50S ribosomal protein L23 [Clostridiales bacterium]|jgi:large subunit ribosomal protein L23|nr:50S ribosomal protein L23 [Clostridiales bacterium]MDY4654904.1 50S ribosomal protein L23 [Eubacteriales bacterium]